MVWSFLWANGFPQKRITFPERPRVHDAVIYLLLGYLVDSTKAHMVGSGPWMRFRGPWRSWNLDSVPNRHAGTTS
jgi:hypothetical protein